MHAGRYYTMGEVLAWTRRETVIFILVAAVPAALQCAGFEVPTIPSPPLAVLGVAVAFVTGFKNNAGDRLGVPHDGRDR